MTAPGGSAPEAPAAAAYHSELLAEMLLIRRFEDHLRHSPSLRHGLQLCADGSYYPAPRCLQKAGAPDPFDQPSPGLAWLCHPALTGLPAHDWDTLTATLMTLHDQQREASLAKRRGHRPRLTAPGTGRRPGLTLADRLLATILHYRRHPPQVAIAALFSVRPETTNKRIRDVRQLLDQAGHTIQPGPHRLANLDDLRAPAGAAGLSIPSEIKTAC